MEPCRFDLGRIVCDVHRATIALCTHAAADLERDLRDVAYALAKIGCDPTKPLGPQVAVHIDELVDLNRRVEAFEQLQQAVSVLSANIARLEEEKARLQRYPFEPICLNCGALTPCMTEADLKPGDPGVPCTFDPTPRQLFEENAYLRERLAQAEAYGAAMRRDPRSGRYI